MRLPTADIRAARFSAMLSGCHLALHSHSHSHSHVRARTALWNPETRLSRKNCQSRRCCQSHHETSVVHYSLTMCSLTVLCVPSEAQTDARRNKCHQFTSMSSNNPSGHPCLGIRASRYSVSHHLIHLWREKRKSTPLCTYAGPRRPLRTTQSASISIKAHLDGYPVPVSVGS